jgi:hypothetical protein
MTKPITKAQLSKIHVLMNQLKIIDDKASFINEFTNGRTSSSKEMSLEEGIDLIRHLSLYDPNDKMRKKIFALAYNAGIIWGDTPADKKMNSIKLNEFIKSRGAVKKELNSMSKNDLIKTVSQFEQIIKHNRQTVANKATKSLLEELSIPVQSSKSISQ